MGKMANCLAVIGLLALLGGTAAAAQKGPLEMVTDGCKKELDTYCKGVAPGEGRILACLYAFEDKLSNRCEYALYDAATQLERAVNALAYMAGECRDDLKKYCGDVKPGEGRLLNCIDRNGEKLSARCKQAMADVRLKK
ncbi:MAG TPA: cysteine rich repeat-containing protein [Geobacteraceae bacterium]|nr:cysteine rich repeat-containing protein [Geobacteraceae bacterium]